MYEIHFLPVGEGSKSGDAITLRFTHPDTGRLTHVVIDAGFQASGDSVVEHVLRDYGTASVDLAIVTHPDGDHIGGMGTVLRELNVAALALHRLDLRGGANLPAGEAVAELCDVAAERGTVVQEPFAGSHAFGDALLVAGPSFELYGELVAEQLQHAQQPPKAAAARSPIVEAFQRVLARALDRFPVETDFGDAGGDNSRNNSSTIIDLRLSGRRLVLTADAGVRALQPALAFLDARGRLDQWPHFVQVPHHGSRHNLDRATLERLAGPAAPGRSGTAFVSISEQAADDPRYPSPRVANAFGRRGYEVALTAGRTIWHRSADAPGRPGDAPLDPLPPLDERIDDR